MQNYQKRKLKNWTVTILVLGVIAFVGWWGIAKMSAQKTAVVAKSSQDALAPDFTLPSTTGGTITLSDYRGKKNVLLYFHEGLSCPPCWEQIPELEKYLSEFEKMNVAFLSIALDPVEKWKDTIDQYKIKTPILSYDSVSTEVDYNLLPYSMAMGRRAGHTFVFVNTTGQIIWRKDYWPDYGMMVNRGVMFVSGQEVVDEVKAALGQQ